MDPFSLAPTPVAFIGHVWMGTFGSTAYFMLHRRPCMTRSDGYAMDGRSRVQVRRRGYGLRPLHCDICRLVKVGEEIGKDP